MKTRCAVLLLLMASVLAGCDDDPSRPPIEVTGTYRFGFETSVLEPCGLDEAWWVTNPEILAEQYVNITNAPYELVFVSVAGAKSPPGSYGHLGAYSREFTVTEVHVIRVLVGSDCQ